MDNDITHTAGQRPPCHLPNPIWMVAITLPFVLYGLLLLLPTSDDWVYYTTMYGGDLVADGYLLPIDSYWRPFDNALGTLLGRFPWLFPSLNHIIVLAAHVASTLVLYRLCTLFGISRAARFMAVTYFYFSPAMLGTVLGIDSPNQACSHLCGLLGLWAYAGGEEGKRPTSRLAAWVALVITATLFKENGLSWAIIPPLLTFGSGRCGSRELARGITAGVAVCAAYIAIRLLLTPEGASVKDDYTSIDGLHLLRNACLFIAMTWLPADYVSIVHAPSRNIIAATATVLASIPMLFIMLKAGKRLLRTRMALSLAACMVIAAAPHLLTVFTAMHSYAALSMAALLMGVVSDKAIACRTTGLKTLLGAFAIYMAAALFTDAHHWQASYRSGLTGRDMADQIITQTGKSRPQKVFLIIIDSGSRKYSSFCVIPAEAFGWGRAVVHRTGLAWPEEITDVTIPDSEASRIPAMTRRAIGDGYDAVWLAGDNGAKVLATK